jgi:hypothetical protein
MTDKHTPKRGTCGDCEVNWDRKGNVKTVVLCRFHTAAPELLKALETNTVYLEAVYDTLPSLAAARQGAGLIKQAHAAIKAAKGDA